MSSKFTADALIAAARTELLPLLPLVVASTEAFALKYYEQKEYDKALPLFKQLAEQGNAIAQLNLGKMYFNGYGVTKDNAQAVYWFHKSAERGNTEAKNYIDDIYINILDEPKEILKFMKNIVNISLNFIKTVNNVFEYGANEMERALAEQKDEHRKQALADQEDNDK
jgi:TPR repeat protein